MNQAFEHAIRLVEAFVFASAEPVATSAVARLVPMPYSAHEVLEALQDRCRGRGVELVEVGGGWQFRTALDLAAELATVMAKPRRLPQAAMETLAIVAQYQPLTRAEIESIRGVSLSQATVDLLLEAGLIAPKGVRETPGRPTLWATTPAFLAHFGLSSIRDLPGGAGLTLDPSASALAGTPALPDERARAEGGSPG
jgi:segregation and condensation protein B